MTTTTHERLRQWVAYWREDAATHDAPPRKPRDVSEYHDRQLTQVGRILATIERERGR